MREIKFRAWDKESDMMIFQHEMNAGLENKEYYFSLSENGVELLRYDEDYSAYVMCNAEIMQYIGIEDEGEKEIYEGDIVKRIDRTPIAQMYGKEVIDVVVFTEGSFSLNTHEGYYLMNNNRLSNLCSYKVIGNIYENPELLNKI